MTEIEKISVGIMPTNCYVLYSGRNAVLVDPGGDYEKVNAFLEKKGLKALAVVLTHGHFDHIKDVTLWQKSGADLYVGAEEKEFLNDGKLNLSERVNMPLPPIRNYITFSDGETLRIGGITLSAIHTPGHTRGSYCLIADDCRQKTMLTGDTLFCESYGNCTFETGSAEEMKHSVCDVLFGLEGDYLLLPGHGDSTTLNQERMFNTILLL